MNSNRIRVLFDDRGIRQKFGGISRCFAETIKRLPEDIDWRIAARATMNHYFHEPPYSLPYMRKEFTRQDFCRKFLGGHYIHGLDRTFCWLQKHAPGIVQCDMGINDCLFKRLARQNDFDVVHLTEPHCFNYDWVDSVRDKPLVVTVHDVIPDEMTESWFGDDERRARRVVLERANRIVAVSNYTKDQIARLYGIDPLKISVVYHGSMIDEQQEQHGPFDGLKYILYMGGRWTYKNFGNFIRGIAPILKSRRDLHAVCTGHKFNDEERALIEAEGITDHVIQQFVSDRQMRALYAHAQAFVYPSLKEGFGIPILDSFASWCPAVLSRSSCFPEIAGDAALYFDGDDPSSLTRVLHELLDHPQLADAYRKKGEARAKLFSWERAANELADVYRSVVGVRPNETHLRHCWDGGAAEGVGERSSSEEFEFESGRGEVLLRE